MMFVASSSRTMANARPKFQSQQPIEPHPQQVARFKPLLVAKSAVEPRDPKKPRKGMKYRVIELAQSKPRPSAKEIALKLECSAEYVRKTAKRNNLKLRSEKYQRSNTMLQVPNEVVDVLDRYLDKHDMSVAVMAGRVLREAIYLGVHKQVLGQP